MSNHQQRIDRIEQQVRSRPVRYYTQLVRRELLPELRAANLLAKGLYTFQGFMFRTRDATIESTSCSRVCLPEIPPIGNACTRP